MSVTPSKPANKHTKLTKKSVHYRKATGRNNCGNCIHDLYKEGDKVAHCAIVAGIITSKDVCDRYKKKSSGTK